MADKDKYKNKINEEDDSGSQGSDTGGQGGKIEFADFIGTSAERDDNLPPDELRRRRAVHNADHEARVKKQKALREHRQEIKDGKQPRDTMARVQDQNVVPHPILANAPQFSGIDKQENPDPSHNETQTNDADRDELQNTYRKQHQPEMGKKFIPPTPLPR